MNRNPPLLAVLALAAAGLLAAPAQAQEYSGYTVAGLLEPCMLGDNDARDGAQAEALCEQYISGFIDAFLSLVPDPKADGICLPPAGNRPDEVRWAFTHWAHMHFHQRNEPAAVGLMATVKSAFLCK